MPSGARNLMDTFYSGNEHEAIFVPETNGQTEVCKKKKPPTLMQVGAGR
jgi:hypothetical protein